MRESILAGEADYLTTGDAARMLELTGEGVRKLVRTAQLACRWTVSGRRVFLLAEVQRVVKERARARLRRVTAARPLPPGEPRQLALFGGARLRLVTLSHRESELVEDPQLGSAESRQNARAVR